MTPIDYEKHFPWYADPDDTTNIDCQCGHPCDGIAGWATHIQQQHHQPPERPQMNAFQKFLDNWSTRFLADDIADKLRCEEAEALAGMLRVLGADEAATYWLTQHSSGDECGDSHHSCELCTAP